MVSTDIKFSIVKELANDDVIDLYKAAGWWEETEKAQQIIPAMIKGSFCFMIATHQGKTIGMGRVISDGVSDAYIQDVVVKEEYRNMHIGKEIIKRLIQYCNEHQLDWIGLISEPKAVPFYESLGFDEMKGFKPMLWQKE